MPDAATETVHASTVCWQGQAAVIMGPSGSGKSSLALTLMACGCDLVADDRTVLSLADGQLCASSPLTIAGRIEARGVGILDAKAVSDVPVACVIDLSQEESERLPEARYTELLGTPIRLFHKSMTDVFPFAILQYLKSQDSPRRA